MKLFSEFAALMEECRQPWYVANRPTPHTAKEIFEIAKQAGVQNLHQRDKYHCTLIYSREPCKEPKPRKTLLIPVQAEKWDIFKSRDGKNCLVLKLNSAAMQQRHKQLMKELEASYDFPTYLPHITVSYDAGDIDTSKLPLPERAFVMTGEYCELLDDLD